MTIILQRKQNFGAQSGSMSVVFAGLVLPLLFVLATLTFDVAVYYADQEKTQSALDETALYAYRFLPRVDQAQSAALTYAARFGELTSPITPNISRDIVDLSVRRPSTLTFARLLGFGEATLPIVAVSRARGTPLDVFITMDTTGVSPALYGGTPIGSATDWPSAQYFRDNPLFRAAEIPPDPRLLTQQCFSPSFVALKKTAIGLYDYLSAFQQDSVGVGFYTGESQQPVIVARQVGSLGSFPLNNPTDSPAQFVGAVGQFRNPSYCLRAAEMESSTVSYQLPPTSSDLEPVGNFSARPLNAISPITNLFDSSYQPYLQGREVIWAQPASEAVSNATPGLFIDVLSRIIGAPARSERGGLVDQSVRVGILLSSDLPRYNGEIFPAASVKAGLSSAIGGVLDAIRSSQVRVRIKLYYLLLDHDLNGDVGLEVQPLQNFFDSLVANAGVTEQQFSVQVVYASSAEQLTETAMRYLALMNRSAVVSVSGII